SLRMKGTCQYLHPKIFSWDRANGVRLFEQRPSDVPFPLPFPLGLTRSGPFALVLPSVNGDGSEVAVTGVHYCPGLTPCRNDIEEFETTIYTAGETPVTLPGSAILSRNGRYAFTSSSVGNT